MLLVLSNTTLDVFSTGVVLRQLKSGRWKEIPNAPNHTSGFNVIYIDRKQFMRSHIVARCFLADFPEKGAYVFHIDGCRLNTKLSNLKWRHNSDRDKPTARTIGTMMTHLFGDHAVRSDTEVVLNLDHTSEHLNKDLKEGSPILLKILKKYKCSLIWIDENQVSVRSAQELLRNCEPRELSRRVNPDTPTLILHPILQPVVIPSTA